MALNDIIVPKEAVVGVLSEVVLTPAEIGASASEPADDIFRVVGSADPTKKVAFEVDGLTTATTSTLTVPASGTIARTEDFAAPPAIGSTTPNTGAFTSLSANNGTLTASAPVLDLAQTWNNAAVAFTAINLDITNTASAFGSQFLQFSIAGVPQVRFQRNFSTPVLYFGNSDTGIGSSSTTLSVYANGGATASFGAGGGGMNLRSDSPYSWASSTNLTSANDLSLFRDAADTLAQRRATNPQAFRIYTTWANNGVDFERLFIKGQTLGAFQIGTEKGGTGAVRDVEVYRGTERRIAITSTGTQFRRTGSYPNGFIEVRDITSSAAPFTQATAGVGLFFTNFSGTTSGALYAANNGTLTLESVSGARIALTSLVGMTGISLTTAGVPHQPAIAFTLLSGKESGFYRDSFANAATERFFAVVNRATVFTFGLDRLTVRDTALLCFGGTTSSFPALKRDTTTLQVRLADDSAFAPFECAGLTLNGDLTASTRNIVTDTTTGTKIGTATTQKIGFFNATPVVQQAAVADATDAATAITQLNDLLAAMRTLGLIAT
jgi:hypothetical protein